MRGGGGAGLGQLKSKVSAQAVEVMAWASFVLAIIGGAALTKTWFSDWAVGMFGWAGSVGRLVAAVALAAGLLLLARDLLMDWTPNYPALIVAVSLPTVARACSGGLSRWITVHSQMVLTWFNQHLGGWVPNGLAGSAVAACTLAAAFVLAQRTVPKSHGGR